MGGPRQVRRLDAEGERLVDERVMISRNILEQSAAARDAQANLEGAANHQGPTHRRKQRLSLLDKVSKLGSDSVSHLQRQAELVEASFRR